MKKAAHIISAVFSPLLVPTYAMVLVFSCTQLRQLPWSSILSVTGLVLLLTAVVPALLILALKMVGVISQVNLDKRTDRTIPYTIVALLYIAVMIYLYRAQAPSWLSGFMLGATIAIIAVTVVNLKWKISAHMTAMGGLVALSLAIPFLGVEQVYMLWPIIATLVASGLTGSARIELDCHTPAQVGAGFAVGLVAVFLCCLL